MFGQIFDEFVRLLEYQIILRKNHHFSVHTPPAVMHHDILSSAIMQSDLNFDASNSGNIENFPTLQSVSAPKKQKMVYRVQTPNQPNLKENINPQVQLVPNNMYSNAITPPSTPTFLNNQKSNEVVDLNLKKNLQVNYQINSNQQISSPQFQKQQLGVDGKIGDTVVMYPKPQTMMSNPR